MLSTVGSPTNIFERHANLISQGLKKVYGQLIFGGMDLSRFVANQVSFKLAEDISRDLLVAIQSIPFTGHDQTMLLSDPIYAFIDSTDPNIRLSSAACAMFEDAFGISRDNATGLYLVSDTRHAALLAEDAEVTFRLRDDLTGGASVAITLPYSAFALTAMYPMVSNSSDYFPLKQATDQSQYTLGRVSLQEAYLTVDYERGNSPSPSACGTCLQNQTLRPFIHLQIPTDLRTRKERRAHYQQECQMGQF